MGPGCGGAWTPHGGQQQEILELGTRWEALRQPYLWASALNLFWRHKEIGHQEEHVLSLEDKCQGWSLLPAPIGRCQKPAAWLVWEGALAP